MSTLASALPGSAGPLPRRARLRRRCRRRPPPLRPSAPSDPLRGGGGGGGGQRNNSNKTNGGGGGGYFALRDDGAGARGLQGAAAVLSLSRVMVKTSTGQKEYWSKRVLVKMSAGQN